MTIEELKNLLLKTIDENIETLSAEEKAKVMRVRAQVVIIIK